jgi:hypothetical protein
MPLKGNQTMKHFLFTLIAFVVLASGHSAFATIGAVVTSSQSSVQINQPVTVNVAISNSGSSALTLSNLSITASYNDVPGGRVPAAFSFYVPNSVSLPALTTTTVPMQAVFFSPSTGITNSGTGYFGIGANFNTSDGSITSAATGVHQTVTPVPLPAYERL